MPRENIPDKDLFMMCEKVNPAALSDIPPPYSIRLLRKDELVIWKALHVDAPEDAAEYDRVLTAFYDSVYAPHGDLFFRKCMVACDQDDRPIGTCFIWKSYENRINTIHWLKVSKPYEGKGIGRALLSTVMDELDTQDYPVFLHTHPSSYRAIKLYADFGFKLLADEHIGNRPNDLAECLPILREWLPPSAFAALETTQAPVWFLDIVNSSALDEF